jgi:uncharacterized protein (DUF697 family)
VTAAFTIPFRYNRIMDIFKDLWGTLRDNILSPRLSPDELDRHLHRARASLPIPVFWLLGKAQSGKTSIIRALTGSSRAEIGDGFRPCTRYSQLYSFPSDGDCLARFLDTRGLGEVGYDPSEDMRFCAEQSHLLMVVVRAMDHAQHAVLDAVAAAKRANPQWPILVVQTTLHEGYLAGGRHIVPYPYDQTPLPASVPPDLARSLAAQRERFAHIADAFVCVDLTLPQDGFDPEHYGIESLWSAIESVLPLGLRGILEMRDDLRGPLKDAFFRTARPHIVAYALASGAAAMIPVPLVDVPLVLATQAKMFHTVASLYGQSLNTQLLAEFGGALGAGFLTRMFGRELAKLVPGVGSAVSGTYTAATTYALGCALCAYFSHIRAGDVPDAARIRELFANQLEQGRKDFAEYLSQLRKNRDQPSNR